MSDRNRQTFLREYSTALREGSAALFVGAGLSRSAGYVDWKALLSPIAQDLGLDVQREHDLPLLAQFHVNDRGGRDHVNQTLIDQFAKQAQPGPNHELIARLPVRSVWTTNFDELLEQAFQKAEKRWAVLSRNAHFPNTVRNPDVVLYKMHGDCRDSQEAILTKEDFEQFEQKRGAFSLELKTQLLQKTFLFVGYSFADPNLAEILVRITHLVGKSARKHYFLVKQPQKDNAENDEYSLTRFPHWLKELSRYNLIPVLMDSYDDITQILRELNRRQQLRDIFISGSAHDDQPLGKDRFQALCRLLGQQLIANDYNIISGYGLGVAEMVISGAMQALGRNDDERLQIRPFPQSDPSGWTTYRRQMLTRAGVCIVVSGNKLMGGSVVAANGVLEEVSIARSLGKVVLPIGATGHVAQTIWTEMNANLAQHFESNLARDIGAPFAVLGNTAATPHELVAAVIQILNHLNR